MTWDHPAQPPRILMKDGRWDPAVPAEVRKRLLGRPEPVVTDKGISFAKMSIGDSTDA